MSSELPTVLRGWQITQAKKKGPRETHAALSHKVRLCCSLTLCGKPCKGNSIRSARTCPRVTRSAQTKPVRALDAFPDLRRGGRRRPHTIAGSASAIFRKEVIQPQVLLRLPCYDFTPIMSHTLGACVLAVRAATSSTAHFRDVTGGVYKARERIHRSVLICDY